MNSTSKSELRQTILKQRDAIPAEERQRRSDQICTWLMATAWYQNAKTILAYSAIKSELDLSTAMNAHLARGGQLILPRINRSQNSLDLYRITDLSAQTIAGAWGIREPDPSRCQQAFPGEIDLVLIPGAGFDRDGNRLGYGAGFYDRLLCDPAFKGQIVACLFQEQLVPKIPVESHDIPVDQLISDQGVITHV